MRVRPSLVLRTQRRCGHAQGTVRRSLSGKGASPSPSQGEGWGEGPSQPRAQPHPPPTPSLASRGHCHALLPHCLPYRSSARRPPRAERRPTRPPAHPTRPLSTWSPHPFHVLVCSFSTAMPGPRRAPRSTAAAEPGMETSAWSRSPPIAGGWPGAAPPAR